MSRDEEIWELYESGWRAVDLADEYDLTPSRIWQILKAPDVIVLRRARLTRKCKRRQRINLVITAEFDLDSVDKAEDWRVHLQHLIKNKLGDRCPVVKAAVL